MTVQDLFVPGELMDYYFPRSGERILPDYAGFVICPVVSGG